MEKIENWDSIEAKGMEDFKNLPIGAYECIIKDARINHNEENGKDTLKISIDIASGEYKDYFLKSYENDTRIDKKWNNNAVKYLAFEGDNVSYFKGFITCVENSNPGYTWDWNENKLKDKKICGVFLYEEYQKQDGTHGIKVRLNKFRSLDKMKDINISDNIKMLDGSYISYDDYIEKNKTTNSYLANSMVDIPDSALPF